MAKTNDVSDNMEQIDSRTDLKETYLTKEELRKRVIWYETNDPDLLSFEARLIKAFNSEESLDEGESPDS